MDVSTFEGVGAPSAQESLLARIVRVNEEIKAIVATAFKINLMALNAIFLAKRAGTAALGFGVLSNELRRFAEDLTREMAALRVMTAGSVSTVSSLMQQRRLNSILAATVKECADAQIPALTPVVERGERNMDEQLTRLRALDKSLHGALADTNRLAELGGVLARSAKIEAAYGGRYSTALMQVSTDFAEVIELIKLSLEKLTKERLAKDC